MIDVSQKSIVVTGGASGIGAAVCTAAIEQGAYIGVIDIDEDAGRTICGKSVSYTHLTLPTTDRG